MLVALVVVTPLAGWAARARDRPIRWRCWRASGVGISSSVIPYVSDQLAMRRLARATYALMVSLLPATATVIGIVVLAQVPSWRGARRGARDRGRGPAPRGLSRLRRAMQLDGIGALVAGGASGLGEATARELALAERESRSPT